MRKSFSDLGHDVRFAVRSLRRSPGLTLVVLTTLSLGIAVATTFFSLLNAIVYHPLPYKDADRIVMIWKKSSTPENAIGELTRSVRSIDRLAFYENYSGVVTGVGEPASVWSVHVDSGFFPLLRMTPLLGSLPTGRDVVAGAPTLVLGERFWRRQYAADPTIIGKLVQLRGQARRIVAVLPRDFTLPFPAADVWVPTTTVYGPGGQVRDFLARLAPGATHDDVRREMDLVSARLHATDSLTYKSMHLFVKDNEMVNRYYTVGGFVQPLKLLLGAGACVLLIACTNLALLMIVRGARRRGELIIRASLGASRWQLVRQQAVESILLAGTAGVAGSLLSVWGVRLVLTQVLSGHTNLNLPGWLRFGIDWRVAAFAMGLSLITVAIVGIWPSRAATRFDLAGVLRSDADRGVAGGDPTRTAHLPIVLQLTLSLALFAGAVMMGFTYARVARVDLGYDPRNLYDASIATDADSTSLGATMFFRNVRDQLVGMPGVQASLSSRFESFNGEKTDGSVYVPGAAAPVNAPTEYRPDPAVVSDDYFRVMKTPMIAGRPFNRGDTPGSAVVAIVSKAFALKAWGTVDAIGKTLVIGRPLKTKGNASSVPILATVVGIAGDFRAARVGETSLVWARPDAYVSDRQARFTYASVMVRSPLGPSVVRKTVAAAVERAGRQLPIDVTSREVESTRNANSTKALAVMMGTFAAVSLSLALMGIYGIVAFGVEQRTRELGIRVALGAQASDIVRSVVGAGVRLTAIGLGLGLLTALMMGRLMSAFIVGAVTSHVLVAVAATAVFALVALLASYLPARRAAKLDPIVALRR